MGYNSNFFIRTFPPIKNVLISEDYKLYTDNHGKVTEYSITWYNANEEIKEASKNVKDVLFILERYGDQTKDIEYVFTKNGFQYSESPPLPTPESIFVESKLYTDIIK